jgi:hypothetical protein
MMMSMSMNMRMMMMIATPAAREEATPMIARAREAEVVDHHTTAVKEEATTPEARAKGAEAVARVEVLTMAAKVEAAREEATRAARAREAKVVDHRTMMTATTLARVEAAKEEAMMIIARVEAAKEEATTAVREVATLTIARAREAEVVDHHTMMITTTPARVEAAKEEAMMIIARAEAAKGEATMAVKEEAAPEARAKEAEVVARAKEAEVVARVVLITAARVEAKAKAARRTTTNNTKQSCFELPMTSFSRTIKMAAVRSLFPSFQRRQCITHINKENSRYTSSIFTLPQEINHNIMTKI